MSLNRKPRMMSAYLVLTVGVLAVSSASILIRTAQQEAASLTIAAYRLTIATIVLLPITLRQSGTFYQSLTRKQIGLLAASGLMLALHFATWITSLEMTSVVSSVVLVATTPLWVALASPVFLKEKITPVLWLGVGFSLVGSLIVALGGICGLSMGGLQCDLGTNIWTGESLLGNGLALVGAWCAAGYMLIGRRVRPAMPLSVYTICVYGCAAIVLLALAVASGVNFLGIESPNGLQLYSPVVWLCLVGLAVGPQLIGHTSYNWALGYLPAATVSVALLGEPIGTTLLAFFILKEAPSIVELLGGALILAGIFLASRVTNQAK
jgi:drug/metabolite transporter (DMT)-like permease